MRNVKLLGLALALNFVAPLAFAENVKVQVNGMVCAFCAQGITKKFQSNAAVEGVKVDLDKKEVNLSLKKDKTLPDADIEKVIKDSGFVVVKIERTK